MTKRTLHLEIHGSDGRDVTPGPDQYNLDKVSANNKSAMATIEEKERVPVSVADMRHAERWRVHVFAHKISDFFDVDENRMAHLADSSDEEGAQAAPMPHGVMPSASRQCRQKARGAQQA